MMLGQAYEQRGQLDQAASIWRSQVEQPGSYLLLGKVLRQQGKPDEAREALESALERSPKEPAVVYELMELELQQGDVAAAKALVRDLAEGNKDWNAHYLMGRIHEAEKDWAAARKELAQSIEQKPDWLPARDLLVRVHMMEGQPEKAISQLQEVLKQAPGSVTHQLQLGQIYSQTGKSAQAVSIYRALLEAQPDNVSALNNLAYLYAKDVKMEDATTLPREARNLAPGNPMVADTLGWILYQRGSYQEAVTLLSQSAAAAPDQPEAQYHLGMAQYMMGNRKQAAELLTRAVNAGPDFSGKAEAKRTLELLANFDSITQEDLEAHLANAPQDMPALLRLAELQEEAGALDEALASYGKVLKINPDQVDALLGMGWIQLEHLEDFDAAQKSAQKARDLAPVDPKAAALLGTAVLRQGNSSYAYDLLSQVRGTVAKEARFQRDLAMAAYQMGRVNQARDAMGEAQSLAGEGDLAQEASQFLKLTAEEAEVSAAELEAILSADPNSLPALLLQAEKEQSEEKLAAILKQHPGFVPAQKALLILQSGDEEKADESYTLATKLRETLPNDPEIARVLGQIVFWRGDSRYAIQLLSEANEANPLDAEGQYYLGMAYLNEDESMKGKQALRAALDLGLEGEKASEAEAKLEPEG